MALGSALVLGLALGLVFSGDDPGQTPTTLVTATIALAVAALTVVTTDRRQAHQVHAEHEQLREQLAHERGIADRAELRALLDEAAVALHRTRSAQGEAQVALTQYGARVKRESPGTLTKIGSAGQALDGLHARLAIRLGRWHKATEAYANAVSEASEVFSGFAWAWHFGEEEGAKTIRESADRMKSAATGFRGHLDEFQDIAAKLVGVRLDGHPLGRAMSEVDDRVLADVSEASATAKAGRDD